MGNLNHERLTEYIHEHVVQAFYTRRTERMHALSLDSLLLRKNPYLFRTKNIMHPWEYVTAAIDAHLSSQEETMFGDLMEGLAIHVCNAVYGGTKAPTKAFPSIDLLFTKDGVQYMVGIKSGVNWGNSDQINRMKENFKKARAKLRAQGVTSQIVAVNGCMYGRDATPYKIDRKDSERSYYKYCGQDFWEFVSADPTLYIELIEPLEQEAKVRGPVFQELYSKKINELVADFSGRFLVQNAIDWNRLIEYVSAKKKPNGTEIISLWQAGDL